MRVSATVLYVLATAWGSHSVSAFSVVSLSPLQSSTTKNAISLSSSRQWSSLRMAEQQQDSNDSLSLEEEVEQLVQAELATSQKVSKMKSAQGVQYAPWLNVSPEDEQKMRAIMREKAEARRKRQLENQTVRGSLLKDSTNQELSGTGIRVKVLDGNNVELTWATGKETNTKGFLVKRRPAKTEDFQTLASYETYGPLASKGLDGGVYRYLDENVDNGAWVYRVTECENNGNENDLSQCLVDIESQEEQQLQKVALAGFAVLAVAALASGFLLDPVQY